MASNVIINRSPDHALQVCSNCKIRKKACDKAFPSCGYYTYRALVCRYTAPASLPEAENNDSETEAPSYREFILSLEAPATTTAADMESFRISCSSMPSSLMLMDTISDSVLSRSLSFGKLAESLGLDGILHDQVHSIIRATGQFIDDVTVRYFRGIHEWIPVISRGSFQNRLINSSAPARADFSILLLSMCLITYRPSRVTAQLINQDTMYFTTKMLFAHVQAFISSSPNLIQAGILISIYEYAHGKLDTAYNSIANCAKMAHAIGLHKLKSSLDPQENEASLGGDEEKNIWWGIVIYERAIFCDIMPADQPLATRFPSSFVPLPSESAVLDRNGTTHVRAMTRLSVSAVDIKHVGGFGRQTQAAYLLDQVLNIIKIVDIKTKLLELGKADKDLMGFLGILLEKSYKAEEHYCGSIAICIRALYVLHCYILDQAFTGLENWGQYSAAALDTVSKMVIDIADYCNKQCDSFHIHPPPPTTFYIVQAALKHLDTDPCLEGDFRSKDYEALRKFLDNFHNRWSII
ncbi:hypothetical protein V1517DRAFT_191187 [Lipomyces orientalis]|uniref:Uncharacterized protein n=1 Tax=Lipomyces orientalis TaxID=1233043 RepID=A0ACC3TVW5_9ASCO